MYDEEAWANSLNRFLHGPMLQEILEKIGEEVTQENKLLIKEAFKKRLRVDSWAKLTARERRVMIDRMIMIMSRDFAIEINAPGYPEGASDEDKTLTEFFHLIFEYNKQKP